MSVSISSCALTMLTCPSPRLACRITSFVMRLCRTDGIGLFMTFTASSFPLSRRLHRYVSPVPPTPRGCKCADISTMMIRDLLAGALASVADIGHKKRQRKERMSQASRWGTHPDNIVLRHSKICSCFLLSCRADRMRVCPISSRAGVGWAIVQRLSR